MAAMLVAKGQGLIDVSIPSQKAVANGRSHSSISAFLQNCCYVGLDIVGENCFVFNQFPDIVQSFPFYLFTVNRFGNNHTASCQLIILNKMFISSVVKIDGDDFDKSVF